jgi:hypothetical protein
MAAMPSARIVYGRFAWWLVVRLIFEQLRARRVKNNAAPAAQHAGGGR